MTAASEPVEIRPGLTPIADWRAVYRGVPVTLDPVTRCDVEAGRTALSEILAKDGKARDEKSGDSPSVVELVKKHGEPLPNGLVRLFVALKLASLAQGMSGVRWHVVEAMRAFLSHDLLPVVAAEGASDRMALSRLFSALTGTGEILRGGRVRPAQKALKKEDLTPVKLNPPERAALLSGAQLSIAAALAGLFEAERVFQSAVVAAALTAVGRPGAAFHPNTYRLHRQRGQIEVATAYCRLLGIDAAQAALTEGDFRPARLWPMQLGASLDLLRQAAALLERAARSVSEDPLVLWQEEAIVAGTSDLTSVALASDLIALALRTIGDLSETRLDTLPPPAQAAANENSTALAARAAAFAAENRERAQSNALDPNGVWRLLPMVGSTALIIAVEVLEAAHAAEGAAEVPEHLAGVLKAVREVAADATAAGVAANLASVGAMVGSGALAAAAEVQLPSLSSASIDRPASR